MKKPFHINNYLNQKATDSSSRLQEASRLPQSRSEKLDFYQQYLQRNNLQHSESSIPYLKTNSPIKRTITAETEELSYVNTARQKDAIRKDSEDTQKNQLTHRLFQERSAPERTLSSNTMSASQSSSGKTPRQWQFQLENNINKLKDIKGYLQNQISQLQYLLDQTSQGLPNFEQEFSRIREKVMDYTARSLDAAFAKYRRQMTRWSKYQEVEKKSLQVVLEMRDYIKQGEKILEQLRSASAPLPSLTNSLKQVGNRVQHYQHTANEVKRVREECLRKHPTLSEDKVLEFEKALEQLCCF